jgi:hypothetical protein
MEESSHLFHIVEKGSTKKISGEKTESHKIFAKDLLMDRRSIKEDPSSDRRGNKKFP